MCALNLGPPRVPLKNHQISSLSPGPSKITKNASQGPKYRSQIPKTTPKCSKMTPKSSQNGGLFEILGFHENRCPSHTESWFFRSGWVPGRLKINKKPPSLIFKPWIPKTSVLNPILDQKVSKRCPTEYPRAPHEVPKGSQNPPKIIKSRTLLPNGTPRASEDASGTTQASKMEHRDLKSYHLGPQKWSFHTHFQSCLLSKFKKIP